MKKHEKSPASVAAPVGAEVITHHQYTTPGLETQIRSMERNLAGLDKTIAQYRKAAQDAHGGQKRDYLRFIRALESRKDAAEHELQRLYAQR